MHISIFQAILLGLLYYLTNNGTPWVTGLGSVSIRQPIVCGAITGLILGDVKSWIHQCRWNTSGRCRYRWYRRYRACTFIRSFC